MGRWPLRSFALLTLAAAAAAAVSCSAPAPQPAKLAPVAALAKPSLPPWIGSVSPLGKADTLAQIRVIFAKPLIAVQALSGDGPRGVLSHVRIEPALRGHFTVLTPRMIGFVADQALPTGTRVQVTLTAGLHDLTGDSLADDLVWTFETDQVEFTSLPSLTAIGDEGTPTPAPLNPKIRITSNAAVDTDSLASHALLTDGKVRVSMTAALEVQPTPYPGSGAEELFNPALKTWVYDLQPSQELTRATRYRLKISPGVAPVYGNLPTTKEFYGELRTYGALTMVPTPLPSPNGDSRFAAGDPVIAFNNDLDAKSVVGAVTISPAPASVKTLAVVQDYQRNAISIDPYALDPNSTYTATVGAGVKDVFG